MSKKITARKMIQEKWDICSRKRKTAIIASFCIVLVFGIGVTVIASSRAFYATQSTGTSRQIGKKETLNSPLTQESDAAPAQMPDKPTTSEDHPAAPPNDQSGDQNSDQKSKEALPEKNSAAPKQGKADHDEQQASCDTNCPDDQQATNREIVTQPPREQKYEAQPQPKPQPAPAAPAKPAAKKSGHWETVVDKPAWDEPIYETVTDYRLEDYYVYNYDGYRTTDDNDTHGEELALAGKPANYHVESVKEPIGSHKEQVDTIHHEAETHQVWVEE